MILNSIFLFERVTLPDLSVPFIIIGIQFMLFLLFNYLSLFPIIKKVPIIFRKESFPLFLQPEEIELISRYDIPVQLKDLGNTDTFLQKQAQTSENWSFQWLEMDIDVYEEDWGGGVGAIYFIHPECKDAFLIAQEEKKKREEERRINRTLERWMR